MQVFHLGRVDYVPTYEAMQGFTEQRHADANVAVEDQLWICEHPPVYTQGLAGKAEHLYNPGNIPVVQTNRGGKLRTTAPGRLWATP